MPHCILEFSKDLDHPDQMTELVRQIHKTLFNSNLFDQEKGIKVRAVPITYYSVGGAVVPFVHATVKLLSGRTDQQKMDLSDRILDIIFKLLPEAEDITVDITDMNPKAYGKKRKQ